jgi:predicted nucleotidyltransferase
LTLRRLQFGDVAAIASAMDRETVIKTLRAHEAELRDEGVSHVYLFGSVARGEADERSDVDLFYDYDNPRFSLLNVVRVKRMLGELLGAKVDAMTRRSVHPRIRAEVELEALQVF